MINQDICFLLLFMGNDYIPKLAGATFPNLLEAYLKLINNVKYGFYDINKKFNIDFFKRILIFLINSNKNKKFILSKFNKNMCYNYLEGLFWCSDMYLNTTNIINDYMYKYTKSVRAIDIFYYIILENPRLIIKINKNMVIPKKIFPYIVLPEKVLSITDKKYYDWIKKEFPFLYDEENCKQCITLCSNIQNCKASLKYMESIQETNEEVNSKYKLNKRIYLIHKRKHKNINVNDIKNIITKFNLLKE